MSDNFAGQNGHYQAQRRMVHIPTVNEALPYTPLGSIIPIHPNLIQCPITVPFLAPIDLPDDEEHASRRTLLEQLNESALGAENASQRCQRTLQEVQKLLKTDGLTNFTFQQANRVRPSAQQRQHNNDVDVSGSHKKRPALGAFAQMVLNGANVQRRTPSLVTPKVTVKQEKNSTDKLHSDAVLAPPVTCDAAPAPPRQHIKVEAVVPKTVTPEQRAKYQVYPDLDHQPTSNAPSFPHPSTDNRSDVRQVSTDQKQSSDAAVKDLETLIDDILRLQDRLQSSMNGSDTEVSKTFSIRRSDGGVTLSLQPEMQNRLESCVQRVVSKNRVDDVRVEDLIRMQQLSQNAATEIHSLSLTLGNDCSENEVEEWLAMLVDVEHGLAASRTLARIMIGAPHRKELQSEHFLYEVLQALKLVVEDCIMPLVESSSGTGDKSKAQKDHSLSDPRFALLAANRSSLQSLLKATTKTLRTVGELLHKTDFDQVNITKVEFLCKTLVFAESATSERDSLFGMQQFETIRKAAMDVFCKVFSKYEDQREYIFDEILYSLEKLPATKQSARQYRLPDAKPIQLVSALLMRLVQTSATLNYEDQIARGGEDYDEDEEQEESNDQDAMASADEGNGIHFTARKHPNDNVNDHASASAPAISRLAQPLMHAAQKYASYIVQFLIRRASSTTKTGDEPYRKLLDIFTEDFLNVLGLYSWPSAELLLFTLAGNMVSIAEHAKSTAPSRSMALEFLGIMGSGILELQVSVRNNAQSLEVRSDAVDRLVQIIDQLELGKSDVVALVAMDGPYAMVLDHLENRSNKEVQSSSARGFHLTEWAVTVGNALESYKNQEIPRQLAQVKETLPKILRHSNWVSEQASMSALPDVEVKLAANVLSLNSKFCRALNRIFSTLLASMSSEQPTVRSRSLKSVDALLEKDPTVLDRNGNVLDAILQRCTDGSPLVRDSALNLVSKCIILRPNLDVKVCQQVIKRAHEDASAAVKKRACKVLRDIFFRNNCADIRASISKTVILKIQDLDEGVSELARSIAEEIFFQPFRDFTLETDGNMNAKLGHRAHVALIVRLLDESDEATVIFGALLRRLLQRSKEAAAIRRGCKAIVELLFDGLIDNSDIEGSPGQDSILHTLTVFAKSCPKVFMATQLERLDPYLSNLSTSDDLYIYRSTIIILRHTLPHQSVHKPEALAQMQANMLKTISKLPKDSIKEVVAEVAPCVWTIKGIIGKGNVLLNMIRSALSNVYHLSTQSQDVFQQNSTKIVKLVHILGEFGKACNFNSQLDEWRASTFTWFKGNSAPALMIQIICPLIDINMPVEIRGAALDAVCSISQSWPEEFLRPDVTKAFEMVFKEQRPELEKALLSGLEAFFRSQDKTADDDENEDGTTADDKPSGTERLGSTYVATNEDSALTSLAQRFLPEMRRLALATCNETATIGAKLIITINSQGLGHPKDSAPALVALETCPNILVAKKAFDAHKEQGLSRESVFEKEYIRGIQLAFEYQQRLVGDSAGYVGQPPTAKLHFLWDVLKAGKAGVRNKFLGNAARKLDFDISSLQPQHLSFVHFLSGNLAFFDYDKIDELLNLITAMDKVFSSTGTITDHAIVAEILKTGEDTQMDAIIGSAASPPTDYPHQRNEVHGLDRLTIASQALLLIWETRSFLYKTWNLQKHFDKSKKLVKEGGSKNAYRASNSANLTESYLQTAQMYAVLATENDAKIEMCRKFVDTFSIDRDVKVTNEDDIDVSGDDGYSTPSEAGSKIATGSKKRRLSNANGTPRKKSRPSLSKNVSSFNKYSDGDDDDCVEF